MRSIFAAVYSMIAFPSQCAPSRFRGSWLRLLAIIDTRQEQVIRRAVRSSLKRSDGLLLDGLLARASGVRIKASYLASEGVADEIIGWFPGSIVHLLATFLTRTETVGIRHGEHDVGDCLQVLER